MPSGANHTGGDPLATTNDTSTATSAPERDVATATAGARFTILSHHAEGGLGRVHLARDEQLRRTVALKEIRPDRADHPQTRQRFLAEAEITGQLEHPGIVPIYALEQDAAGRPVYAMRFIQGRQLGDAIKAYHAQPTSIQLRELLQRFVTVCQTLAYAHSRGVIHRDLKPANVMLGDYGETLVVDWGLAKRVGSAVRAAPEAPSVEVSDTAATQTVAYESSQADSGSGQLTTAGQVLGTPAYMAPEQARGEVETLGPSADIYALGAILYEILTGQPPYRGSSAQEVLRQVVDGPPPAPRERLPRVPKALNAICQKAMSRTASARYATSAELARDVERWLADEPMAVYREPFVVRAGRWARRHRTLVTAALVAVALLLVASGVFAWWRDRLADEERARLVRNDDQIATLLGQCENALRADDASRAELVLKEAEKRASDGVAPDLADQLAACRTDLDMLKELDRLDDLSWGKDYVWTTGATVVQAWPAAFQKFGIVFGTTDSGDAARRINESRIKDRLLSALNRWLVELGSEPAMAKALVAVLEATDPDDFRCKVRQAILQNDKGRVAELLNSPVALSQPNSFAVAMGRSTALTWERRKQLVREAVRRRPGDFVALMTLGEQYERNLGNEVTQRAAAEQVAWYQAAVAVRPRSGVAWWWLGRARNTYGDSDGAMAAFRTALEQEPTFGAAHVQLGGSLEARGDLDGSLKEYREAVRVAPQWHYGHANLGTVLYRRFRDLDAAIAELEEGIRLAPGYWWTYGVLGEVLLAKRDYDGAIRNFKEVIRLQPDAGGFNQMVKAYEAKGDLDGAVAACQALIKERPNDAKVHAGLGLALKARNDREGARAAFHKAIQLNSTDRGGFYNSVVGMSLHDLGDFDGAIMAYRKDIELHPKWLWPQANVGRALFGKGQFRAAADALRKLPLESADAQLRDWVQRHLKEAELLLPYEGRLPDVLSGKLKPTDMIVTLELAQFFTYHDKKPAAATRFYQMAFALDPKSATPADPFTRYPSPMQYTRYNAPCEAVKAGTGRGSDSPPEAERPPLRKQALTWLRQDLTYYQQLVAKTPSAQNKKLIHDRTRQLLDEEDFTAVRQEKALTRLPSEERKAWAEFWSEVRRLHDQTVP
jgi:tetratricopeptide (TPR) repeat protein/tRNA A-37 threonylcarbamoyl transferase component Bud32